MVSKPPLCVSGIIKIEKGSPTGSLESPSLLLDRWDLRDLRDRMDFLPPERKVEEAGVVGRLEKTRVSRSLSICASILLRRRSAMTIPTMIQTTMKTTTQTTEMMMMRDLWSLLPELEPGIRTGLSVLVVFSTLMMSTRVVVVEGVVEVVVVGVVVEVVVEVVVVGMGVVVVVVVEVVVVGAGVVVVVVVVVGVVVEVVGTVVVVGTGVVVEVVVVVGVVVVGVVVVVVGIGVVVVVVVVVVVLVVVGWAVGPGCTSQWSGLVGTAPGHVGATGLHSR